MQPITQSEPTDAATLKTYQGLLIGNGACGVIVGMVAGFLLMFHLLGSIHVWPLIDIPIDIPGSPGAWRAAHIGPIMNGLLAMAVAFALPHLRLTAKTARLISWGLVFTVWANINFYIFSVFGTAHGLTGSGTPKIGQANIFDAIALMPAMVATIVTPLCMFVVAKAAFRRMTA